MIGEIPGWVTYPDDPWIQITAEEAGLDSDRFAAFLESHDVRGASFGGESHVDGQYSAVLARGGYVVHSWGDPHYCFQTASTGKAFMWALLGFAVADGLLDPDQPIHQSWTGAGLLSHPHKQLDQGFHKNLTWRHLIGRREACHRAPQHTA